MSNSTASAEDQSTAQTLASGSQDIAALAGLFATTSVETNSLASETGYGTVISCTLSILGVLGLVKSTIKLALGLKSCRNSGWSVESLRGIFGYEQDEQAPKADIVHDCLLVEIRFHKDYLHITKKPQRFDSEKMPQIDLGKDTIPPGDPNTIPPGDSDLNNGFTTFNLGNLVHDLSFTQHFLVIVFATAVCSGITAWLITIIHDTRSKRWVFWLGTLVFQLSLAAMVSPGLYHAYLTTRPSRYLTRTVWNVLTRRGSLRDRPASITFIRRYFAKSQHQVLHFRGHVPRYDSLMFKIAMVVVSAWCIVGYICQYTLLKEAQDLEAATWIGIQAGLALLRAIFWVFDPPFDDPKTNQAELLILRDDFFDELSLMNMLTAFMKELGNTEMVIPMWLFDFLHLPDHSLGHILEMAKAQESEYVEETGHRSHHWWMPFVHSAHTFKAEIGGLLKYHWSYEQRRELKAALSIFDFRLLFQRRQERVEPFLLVDVKKQSSAERMTNDPWIFWPPSELFNESDDNRLADLNWTSRQATLSDVRDHHHKASRLLASNLSDVIPLQDLLLQPICDFHKLDLRTTQEPQRCKIFLDASTIRLPRSLRLNQSISFDANPNSSPTTWLRTSLMRVKDGRNGCVDVTFPSHAAASDFIHEYIGWTDEVTGILWCYRLHRIVSVIKQAIALRRSEKPHRRVTSILDRLERRVTNFAEQVLFPLAGQPLPSLEGVDLDPDDESEKDYESMSNADASWHTVRRSSGDDNDVERGDDRARSV